jgi:predicted enzyme related to lactoylglutathione lyase
MRSTTTSRTTGIDGHHYLAKDLERARTFYRDVVGLRGCPESTHDNGTEFVLSDGNAFGVFKLPEKLWYPCGGAMFAVSDIDAAAKRLRDAGARFYTEIMETPVCRVAWCEDPEGNNFAIHQRK